MKTLAWLLKPRVSYYSFAFVILIAQLLINGLFTEAGILLLVASGLDAFCSALVKSWEEEKDETGN